MSVECGAGEAFPLPLCPGYEHLGSKATFACCSPVFGYLTFLCLGFPTCMVGIVITDQHLVGLW